MNELSYKLVRPLRRMHRNALTTYLSSLLLRKCNRGYRKEKRYEYVAAGRKDKHGQVAQRLSRFECVCLFCPSTQKEGNARVVSQFKSESEGYSYGIEFLDQDVDFWNTPFPPAPEY